MAPLDYFRNIFKERKLFNSLLNASPDGLVFLDLQGKIDVVSPSALKMFGYTHAQAFQRSPVEFLIPEERDLALANIVRAFQTGEPLLYEYTGMRSDGVLLDIEVNVEAIRESDSRIGGMILIIRDISARKRSEERLRSSEMRWSFALDGAGDGVWDLNVKTKEIFFSRRLKTMLGYDETEIENRYEEWEKRVHPDDLKKSLYDLNSYVEGKSDAYINEHRLRCKDGSYKWILDRGKTVEWDANGQPVRLVGTHTDITPLKQYQEAILKAKDAADISNQATQRFLSVIAHEFNTPLGLLTVSTDILDRYWDKLDHKGREDQHKKIRSAAKQMSQLISSVTAFTVHQKDYLTIAPQLVDAAQLCRSAVNEVSALWHNERRLEQRIPVECVEVNTCEHLLRRVIVNLLTNACRFTADDGHIVVSLKKRRSKLSIVVADNGIGIPAEDMARITDAFYRGSNVGKRSGLGLGLSIVTESLQKLGGVLKIKSVQGRGTVFRVSLPL